MNSELCLLGPTAVGKTEVALLLARELGAEIVSVDSMQVYRGLDIGTAKPSAEQRARVEHHLVDIVDPTESFNASDFVRLAGPAITMIRARGHVPILCGGTGLYFKALLEGLGEAPAPDPALRAQLEATAVPVLLAELARLDPSTYARIDRQNPRRVIRAVEVLRLTGKPYSTQRATWTPGTATASQKHAILGFCRSPEDLRRRIDLRVDEMFNRGLVGETRQLLEHGLAQNRTALQALGYRQVVEHLRGERSLEGTIELVRLRTRQFAKRQMTWFRNQLPVTWIPLAPNDSPLDALKKLHAELRLSRLPFGV